MVDESAMVDSAREQQAAPVQVGYYAATMGIPVRAMQALKGHARPTGDIGDWPLDDQRVMQFMQTLKMRKSVIGAEKLYHGLMGLTAIGMAIFVPIVAFEWVAHGPSGAARPPAFVALAVLLGSCAGFGVLYYFAARATK